MDGKEATSPSTPTGDPAIEHCLKQVRTLVTIQDPDRRAILQLGYNLGRLSELTQGGRAEFWDRWKAPVADWDQPILLAYAAEISLIHGVTRLEADRGDEKEPGASGNR